MKPYKITIVQSGISNVKLTAYCVLAQDVKEAVQVASEISGVSNYIYVVSIE